MEVLVLSELNHAPNLTQTQKHSLMMVSVGVMQLDPSLSDGMFASSTSELSTSQAWSFLIDAEEAESNQGCTQQSSAGV